ncbi:MAG: hypothetical protein LV481_00770 [Methylacidiphilales bacterium]|nr:hypothetical protein [Candidatus Methylacidiphilales bacterium]
MPTHDPSAFDSAFWSAVAAGCSAIAALIAGGVSLWQGIVIRDHNRLSVRPEIAIRIVGPNAAGHRVGIFVLNAGLGPARVTRIVFKNRETEKEFEGDEGMVTFVLPLTEKYGFAASAQVDTISAGRLIPANTTVEFLWFPDLNLDRVKLREMLARIDVGIEYESLYGEKRPEVWTHKK